ncbi:hypothetical protein MAR_020251 [Mya arenaria]|uniref:Uncharacterized protein n=1 Tax=Mya arenaria TaxID=6604 RepID=A0ABY7E4E2_MYAAR|nr:hypothetical protein MAR_020251 [Mya arenaria]
MAWFLVLSLLVLNAVNVHSAANNFDQPVNFNCPKKSQSINHIHSQHDNYREDRLFTYECKEIPTVSSDLRATCYKTGYVNAYDEEVLFKCEPNYYINEIQSSSYSKTIQHLTPITRLLLPTHLLHGYLLSLELNCSYLLNPRPTNKAITLSSNPHPPPPAQACENFNIKSTHRLSFPVHDGLQLIEVSQFDFQFLHLSLNQQSNQRLDLSLLNRCQCCSSNASPVQDKLWSDFPHLPTPPLSPVLFQQCQSSPGQTLVHLTPVTYPPLSPVLFQQCQSGQGQTLDQLTPVTYPPLSLVQYQQCQSGQVPYLLRCFLLHIDHRTSLNGL